MGRGQVDPGGRAAFLTAVKPVAGKMGADDDRSQERRYADAVVELASGGGSQAQIQVTSSVETLLVRVRRRPRWSSHFRFLPKPWSGCPAIPALLASFSTPSRWRSTPGPPRASFPSADAGLSPLPTSRAASP